MPITTAISFSVSGSDRDLIDSIVDRALHIIDRDRRLTNPSPKAVRINLLMDVTACHANGNPLRLADLAEADDFDIMHDVGGISRHIDRNTGKLANCFLPRFSARMAKAA